MRAAGVVPLAACYTGAIQPSRERGTSLIPVFSGSLFGHLRRKFTLPIGLEAEMDADRGTLTLLQAAVV